MKIYLILKEHKFVFYSNNQKSKKIPNLMLELECAQPSDAGAGSVPKPWGIPHARARWILELFDARQPLIFGQF